MTTKTKAVSTVGSASQVIAKLDFSSTRNTAFKLQILVGLHFSYSSLQIITCANSDVKEVG